MISDTLIDSESVTKPRYSVDLIGKNIDVSKGITNPRLLRTATISLIFLSRLTKRLPNVIKSSTSPVTATSCNLRQGKGGNFVDLRGPEQR